MNDIAGTPTLAAAFKQEELFPIREVSRLTGVNPVTLRAWERRYGLIQPTRTDSGHRLYSQADIERLSLINELTGEGINLAGVIRILDLQGRLVDRDQEIDDLHKRVRRLADRVHELETRESVNSLVQSPTAIVVRRPSSLL